MFHFCLYVFLLKVITTEQRQFDKWVLTSEGSEIVEKGSHEARLYGAVDKENGTLQAHLMVSNVATLDMYIYLVLCFCQTIY